MFFKPGDDIPMYGVPESPKSESSVQFTDGTFLSSTPKSLKIFSEDFGPPIVRLDFKAHHGLPENHLQFGSGTFTERYGEEAKDIFSHIVLKKLKVEMFEK
ncbi:MAG: hypothetical protein AABX44_01925 [Nanoarchaeota archaeon]